MSIFDDLQRIARASGGAVLDIPIPGAGRGDRIPEPELLSVPGSAIREMMTAQLQSCEVAVASYRKADAENRRASVPWDEAIKSVDHTALHLKDMLKHVAEGPHKMTCSQFEKVAHMFSPFKTAEDVIAEGKL